MTLLLNLSRPEGVYACVDHRLTWPNGDLAGDTATKHVVVHYPPLLGGGPKALFSYTGRAEAPDGTPTGQWLRETIRGPQESFDDSLAHLAFRLQRDFGPTGEDLLVSILVVQGDRRAFGAITNVKRTADGNFTSGPEFGYFVEEHTDSLWLANGSGALTRGIEELTEPIHRQLEVSPRRPSNYMKLLATVNRRVAARNTRVSAHSHVAFLPTASSKFEPQSYVYNEPGEDAPFAMPLILCGIDWTDRAAGMHAHTMANFLGNTNEPFDPLNPAHDTRADRRP